MKNSLITILLILPMLTFGQEERKYIREGYKAYMDEDYTKAEIDFRKAEDIKDDSYIAKYNTSAALYQQQKLEESGQRFGELLQETSDPAEQAKLLHNLGNVSVQGQQYEQAVEAYKKSLKLNPGDDDTRYNLAYALEKLREQQQDENEQDQKDQQQNKDQEKEENKDQEKEENKDQEKEENDEQQQQQNEDQRQEEEQQQQQQKQEMSQEEAERLLNAILQKEKDVKEEVEKKKAAAAKIKTDKDW